MQHISAWGEELRVANIHTRGSHWSRIEWFDMDSNNCKKIEHWERIFFVMIWGWLHSIKNSFLLTRRAHSRRNERLNAHINAFGDYHRVLHQLRLLSFSPQHKSAFWQRRSRWKGSQGWEMTLFLHLSSSKTTTAIIDYKSFNFVSFAFEWMTFCALMALFSCSRIYN